MINYSWLMLNDRPRKLANINQYQVILENIEQFHMTSEVDGCYERQAHMTKLSQECHFQQELLDFSLLFSQHSCNDMICCSRKAISNILGKICFL